MSSLVSGMATAAVSQDEVGAASGISNMARYVGASLYVAATATIYNTATEATDVSREGAVANGVSHSALLMMVSAAAGILLAALYGKHRPEAARTVDRAAAAAVVVHTIPAPEPKASRA